MPVVNAYSTLTGEWQEFREERWAIPARDVARFLSAQSKSAILSFEEDPNFPKPIRPGGKRLWIVDELKEYIKTQAPRVTARGTWHPNRRRAQARRLAAVAAAKAHAPATADKATSDQGIR